VEALATDEALARAVVAVETVAATPGGPLALVLLKKRGPASATTDTLPDFAMSSPVSAMNGRSCQPPGETLLVCISTEGPWHLPAW